MARCTALQRVGLLAPGPPRASATIPRRPIHTLPIMPWFWQTAQKSPTGTRKPPTDSDRSLVQLRLGTEAVPTGFWRRGLFGRRAFFNWRVLVRGDGGRLCGVTRVLFKSTCPNFQPCVANAPLVLEDGEMVFATNWFPIWSGTIPIQVKLEMSGGGVHSEIIEVEFPSYGGSERWHESDLFSSEPEDGEMKTKGFQLARDSERSPVHGHWHGKAVRVQPQGDMSQKLGDCRKLKGDGVPAEKTKPPLPGQRRAPTLLSPRGPAALPGAPFVDHEFDIADKRTLESGPPLQGKWSGVSEARGTHIKWFRAPEVVEKMTFGGGDPPVLFDHGAGAEA